MIRPAPSNFFFFFNDTATTEIYTLSLHDALPIYPNEILNLKKKAEIDSKASYRLYEYYTLSEYNEEESMTWLEKAALLGHELAQFNYVKHFYDNGNKKKANSLAKKWKDNAEINKLFLEKNPSNKK